jgi:hypothetical protein
VPSPRRDAAYLSRRLLGNGIVRGVMTVKQCPGVSSGTGAAQRILAGQGSGQFAVQARAGQHSTGAGVEPVGGVSAACGPSQHRIEGARRANSTELCAQPMPQRQLARQAVGHDRVPLPAGKQIVTDSVQSVTQRQ